MLCSIADCLNYESKKQPLNAQPTGDLQELHVEQQHRQYFLTAIKDLKNGGNGISMSVSSDGRHSGGGSGGGGGVRAGGTGAGAKTRRGGKKKKR